MKKYPFNPLNLTPPLLPTTQFQGIAMASPAKTPPLPSPTTQFQGIAMAASSATTQIRVQKRNLGFSLLL